MGVLVGGLEWLVDPQGTFTNIPPPASGGPIAVQDLGKDGYHSSPVQSHEAMEGSDCDSSSRVVSQSMLHAEESHVPLGFPAVTSNA